MFDRYVCGKMSELTFQSVIRPEIESEKCPEGYEKCSKNTGVEDTICL
jgi:hypothetical protein